MKRVPARCPPPRTPLSLQDPDKIPLLTHINQLHRLIWFWLQLNSRPCQTSLSETGPWNEKHVFKKLGWIFLLGKLFEKTTVFWSVICEGIKLKVVTTQSCKHASIYHYHITALCCPRKPRPSLDAIFSASFVLLVMIAEKKDICSLTKWHLENVRIWAFCGKELGLSEKYVMNQTDVSVSDGLPSNLI